MDEQQLEEWREEPTVPEAPITMRQLVFGDHPAQPEHVLEDRDGGGQR